MLAWAIVIALSVAWLLAVGAVHLARRPPEPRSGPPTLELGPEPPAVVNLVTHRWRVTDTAVPATLLDLAARRFVELEHRGPERYVCRLRSKSTETLAPYEQRVIELLRKRESGGIVPAEALTTGPKDESRGWWRGFRKEVVDDAKSRGLSRDLLDKTAFVVLAILAVPGAVVVAALTEGDAGLGYGAVALAILGAVRAYHPQRDTPEGLATGSRWLGVRAELAANKEFARQLPLSVALWERYLAYGAALGVASAAVRAIPMGAESDREAWSSYGGRWRKVRVRYYNLPFPFERGESPRSALFRGLAIGGIGTFILFFLVRVARGVGDVDLGGDRRVWLLVIAVFAVPALMALAGAIQVVRAAVDLWSAREITGQVLRLRRFGGEESGWRYYLAVDDGRASKVHAWPVSPEIYEQLEQGQLVTAVVTPNLRYVRSVTPAAATRSLPEPVTS